MENYFSKHYSEINGIDPDSEESIKEWYNRQLIDADYNLLNNRQLFKAKNILELGCGIGGLMYFLESKGYRNIKGVDISNEQINLCRKYVSKNVSCEDVNNYLNQNSIKYEVIILFDLIEHIQKAKIFELVKAMYDSLEENGHIILRTPNMGCLFALKSRYIDYTHEIGFTKESITQIFQEGGFKNIEVINSYIDKKRLFAVRIFNIAIKKLFNIKLSEIVTENLIMIAKK